MVLNLEISSQVCCLFQYFCCFFLTLSCDCLSESFQVCSFFLGLNFSYTLLNFVEFWCNHLVSLPAYSKQMQQKYTAVQNSQIDWKENKSGLQTKPEGYSTKQQNTEVQQKQNNNATYIYNNEQLPYSWLGTRHFKKNTFRNFITSCENISNYCYIFITI